MRHSEKSQNFKDETADNTSKTSAGNFWIQFKISVPHSGVMNSQPFWDILNLLSNITLQRYRYILLAQLSVI